MVSLLTCRRRSGFVSTSRVARLVDSSELEMDYQE